MTRLSTRVLIVDDDSDWLNVNGFALELMGCGVETSLSGMQALRMATATPPDVIVTDLAMPGMDGVELCEALKAEAATRDVPVLMVTGQPLEGIQDRALTAGCVEVLAKPCAPEVLLAAILRTRERAHVARDDARSATGRARELKATARQLREDRHREQEHGGANHEQGKD